MAALDPGARSTSVRTVCSYCGVGCGIVLDVAQDADGQRRVIKTVGDKAHPANGGRLCTKGATSVDMLAAPGRLTTALLRPERSAEPVPCAVDEAIIQTARRLGAILDEHGPDALAFYVSGQMTLEAQYLANKLAKGFVRTNQIESNSRLCMASASSGYKLSLGADGPPGSYQDFDHADVFFVIGANMADCHPILFLRLMDRVKRGAKLIVVDPRRTPTAEKADLYLQIKPGTDLALLNGLLHLLVDNGHLDEEFIAEFTEGWEAEWLAVTGLDPLEQVEIPGAGALPLAGAFRQQLEITKITSELLRFIAERSHNHTLKTLLRPDNKDELAAWTWGRQAVDVATEFAVRACAQDWVSAFRRLQPRLYSISSSPLTSHRRVRLTVAMVRFTNPAGRPRTGVCSSYLADAPPDSPVSLFVRRSPHFHPPTDPTTPMVMIGPGTGIAPFLGFLDHRKARGDSAPNWLFFGAQHQATDFYYHDELDTLRRDGVLTHLDLAFSRDQRAKIYVQDCMRARGAQLFSWLQDGAHVYVCGDASRMAKDVDRALRNIVAHHGRLDQHETDAYLTKLTTDKRYVRDIY